MGGGSEFEPAKHYPSPMSKVSIIHYLVHVNLFKLFIYLIPVLSLLALMKANGHLNRFLITLDKNKKTNKEKSKHSINDQYINFGFNHWIYG